MRNFDAAEVAALCRQHQGATGQVFEERALERIFELTQGQPWLVNALARQVVEVEVPDRRDPIDVAAVDRAKERLILRRDTHLDSLAERLREPRVRKVMAPFLAGGFLGNDVQPDDIQLVVDLGLLRFEDGNLEIANLIHRELLAASLPISRPAFKEIATLTLGLPQDERAWLAGLLLESLDGAPTASAVERRWAAEIEGRVREVEQDEIQLIPSETVHRQIADRLER